MVMVMVTLQSSCHAPLLHWKSHHIVHDSMICLMIWTQLQGGMWHIASNATLHHCMLSQLDRRCNLSSTNISAYTCMLNNTSLMATSLQDFGCVVGNGKTRQLLQLVSVRCSSAHCKYWFFLKQIAFPHKVKRSMVLLSTVNCSLGRSFYTGSLIHDRKTDYHRCSQSRTTGRCHCSHCRHSIYSNSYSDSAADHGSLGL